MNHAYVIGASANDGSACMIEYEISGAGALVERVFRRPAQ